MCVHAHKIIVYVVIKLWYIHNYTLAHNPPAEYTHPQKATEIFGGSCGDGGDALRSIMVKTYFNCVQSTTGQT